MLEGVDFTAYQVARQPGAQVHHYCTTLYFRTTLL
jgi:hypothetical protein